MKQLVCGLMALGLFLAKAEQATSQPTYSFTRLDMPGSSFPNRTGAHGINASGQTVGSYNGTGTYGFLLQNGNYTTLDVPGSLSTQANGINDSGQIVGLYGAGTRGHGFLLANGSFTTLDVPGSIFTAAYGINASGQIVGAYLDATGAHGFLLDNGSYSTLDPHGSTFIEAYGINASGQIVGAYSDAGGTHGFLLDHSSYTTLDVPGSTHTFARGINSRGAGKAETARTIPGCRNWAAARASRWKRSRSALKVSRPVWGVGNVQLDQFAYEDRPHWLLRRAQIILDARSLARFPGSLKAVTHLVYSLHLRRWQRLLARGLLAHRCDDNTGVIFHRPADFPWHWSHRRKILGFPGGRRRASDVSML
jgi:uncharacterized membrane protein